MEFLFLCFIWFFTVKAFEVKTKYVDIEKERDEARSHCQGNFYQGDLARLEDITNSRQGSIQVWDGNVYKLSPPITIKGCTNDTGLTKHKIPRMKLWKDAAAQCQALCNTSTFAIRDTDCHCLSDSITPADDSHCLPMLARTPAQNSKNTEAKTVFQTVTLEISDVPALNKCIAANGLNPCNFELRNCQDRLQMECKLGTNARTVWAEAAYGCNSAKSFPSPVRDNCPPDSSVWFGGFRDLQYSPGSTGNSPFCKTLLYSNGNQEPNIKEEECDKKHEFYCRYIESGYNETCDINITDSCNSNFSCSYHQGSPTCLCTEDKYWDSNTKTCKTESGYNETCDINITDSCNSNFSCSYHQGSPTCLCTEDKYWDSNTKTCKTHKSLMQTCDVNIPGICQNKLSCQYSHDQYYCSCDAQHYLDGIVCKPVVPYGGACNETGQCTSIKGVSCVSSNDRQVCRCVTESYWNKSSSSCVIKHGYNQTCPPAISNSCKGSLLCRTDNAMCDCQEIDYWDQSEQECYERKRYNNECPLGQEDSCLGDLKCKSVGNSYRCLCDHDALYVGNVCEKVDFSAMVFNTPMSFDDANKTCSDNASYLADSNNLKILLKSCDDNTTLFHAGISPQSGGTKMECVTVRMLDGIIQDGPRNCSEKLPFVCIKKGSNAMDNVCRTVNNVSVPHVSNDQAKNSVTSTVWIIAAAVGGGVLVLAVVVTLVCIKRKRDKTNKRTGEGKATFVNKNNYDAERSSKSGQEDSSCAVHINSQIGGEYGILGEKPSNSPDEDMYSHSRQHQQEGEYDLFAKPVNEPTGIYDHTHNIRQIEGGEYGELGKRVQDVADDDVYSHTKHSKAEGEYDSFSKPTESKNEGDIYDRAHNVLMESAYDEFKKDKDKTSPEGLYDHT